MKYIVKKDSDILTYCVCILWNFPCIDDMCAAKCISHCKKN